MISIVITTYGEDAWRTMAETRAYPSAMRQGASEVVLHHEPNLTIGPARNAAAQKTKHGSRWLLFLDADDELVDGYVTAMLDAIMLAPGDPKRMLFQPTVRYVRKGVPQPDMMLGPKDLRHDNYLVIGTVIHSDLFHEVGGFNDYEHGFEDWSLWAKAWKAGATIIQVPEAVYVAHVNPRSQHRQMWRNRKAQVAMHLQVQAELFPEGIA